jgi:hypothetical protein
MARISTGKNSKQDYQTPKQLIEVCEKRFGKLTLDLAARSYNKVCSNYIAPCTGPEGPLPLDKEAFRIDSFDHDWSLLYKELGGTFWLNCEFGNIANWRKKCASEASRGANILLLIPYGTTTAFIKNVLGVADVYMLVGRLQFIPGESFPKDCVVAHYHPGATGDILFWDWKKNVLKYGYYQRFNDKGLA